MAFLGLSIPQKHIRLWIRHSPAFALVIAAAQWLAEGPRWQMLPAYPLTMLFLLRWLHWNLASQDRRPERKKRHSTVPAAATGLSALALVVAVALPMLAPVFRFAPLTGPYAVGFLVYHGVDAAQSEAFGADPKARRQLMVQIWYLAQAHSPGPPVAYMADAIPMPMPSRRLLRVSTTSRRLSLAISSPSPSMPEGLCLRQLIDPATRY